MLVIDRLGYKAYNKHSHTIGCAERNMHSSMSVSLTILKKKGESPALPLAVVRQAYTHRETQTTAVGLFAKLS